MEYVTSDDGSRIAYDRGGSGPPLVLVHGTTSDHGRSGAPLRGPPEPGRMKQAIVARGDIGMSPGKLAAQVAHASLMAVERADDRAVSEWKRGGQKKVVLKAGNERTLFELKETAAAAGLPAAIVRDAGHTQLDPGTVTALAIGPGGDDAIDAVTGELSLY